GAEHLETGAGVPVAPAGDLDRELGEIARDLGGEGGGSGHGGSFGGMRGGCACRPLLSGERRGRSLEAMHDPHCLKRLNTAYHAAPDGGGGRKTMLETSQDVL